MDQDSNNPDYYKIISLLLRYIAGGILFYAVYHLVVIKVLPATIFTLYTSALFAAIGVDHFSKKN